VSLPAGATSSALIPRILDMSSKSQAPAAYAGRVCVWEMAATVEYESAGTVREGIWQCMLAPESWKGVQIWACCDDKWDCTRPIQGLVSKKTHPVNVPIRFPE
jgi:hypothetical protein